MDFANCGKKLARAGADRSITQQDGIMPLQLVVFALQNFKNKLAKIQIKFSIFVWVTAKSLCYFLSAFPNKIDS